MSFVLTLSPTVNAWSRPTVIKLNLLRIYRSDVVQFSLALLTVASLFLSLAVWVMAIGAW